MPSPPVGPRGPAGPVAPVAPAGPPGPAAPVCQRLPSRRPDLLARRDQPVQWPRWLLPPRGACRSCIPSRSGWPQRTCWSYWPGRILPVPELHRTVESRGTNWSGWPQRARWARRPRHLKNQDGRNLGDDDGRRQPSSIDSRPNRNRGIDGLSREALAFLVRGFSQRRRVGFISQVSVQRGVVSARIGTRTRGSS